MTDKFDEARDAVRRLDWKAFRRWLDANPTVSEKFSETLQIIWQSDSMVRRRSGDDGIKRDRFLEKLSDYFTDRGVSTAADSISEMRTELLKIDRGYVEIHSVVPKLDSAKFTPEQRISAAFAALDIVLRQVLDDFDRKIDATNGVLDVGRNLKALNHEVYDPNSITHGLTLAAGDVVMLEAYQQGWFDTAGCIALPNLEPAEDGSADAVMANLWNANTWRTWKNIDERVRFLDGSLTQISEDLDNWKAKVLAEGGPKIESDLDVAFEFQPDKNHETFEVLANERFDTFSEQNLFKLYRVASPDKLVDQSGDFVELPPTGYVSTDEIHTTLMFSQFTKLDISKANSDTLSIPEILRGYAVLKNHIVLLEREQHTYFPLTTYDNLHAELMRCGLTAHAADSFIGRATFQRSSRDLYDQPLVKTTNNRFYIFGASLLLADLTKILFSSLANFGTSFEEKGEMYEQATIEMLRGHGFNARNLKVSRGNKKEHEFDYDVAFTWEDYVFFLECKNRGLPMSNPIATYHFNNSISGHIAQVKRLQQGLIDYPDILEKDFPEAVGKKAIFCLVNAMPFATGEIHGIYMVDDSILSRFFSSPTFGVTAGQLDGKGPQKRTDLMRIWTGSKPTPQDFISYLARPPQLVLAKENYELAPSICPLSLSACVKISDYRRKDLNSHEISKLFKSGLSAPKRKQPQAGVKKNKTSDKSKRKKAIKASRKARANNKG
ncbi:hypothetical protein [Pseudomonas aeruginosa]|uniref:hypothetical protein n=1 Tax=Pseudomonas aeruginosa TaxID=287 RepID=UPI000A9154E1|nr:hypothetical protein [Pseudomonas aeruginosa]MCO2429631.1 hypothetical protein [Pseudomonas aeruginosa]